MSEAITTTELGMSVPVTLKKPSAWSGGEHDGSRLTAEQRASIRALWAQGLSKLAISKQLGHSRNTIAEVIDENGEIGAHLRETRATRMLVEEEDLRRMRAEVIEDLADNKKLKVGDLNSAMMIGSIAIKDAGGSAPQRIEVSVEHEFKAAAELMTGGARQPVSFAPVMEAELVPLTNQETQSNVKTQQPRNEAPDHE